MKLILVKRGGGKTNQLIEKSAETGCTIVCHSLIEVKRIQDLAKKRKLEIPSPITYDSFLKGNYRGLKINGFLIDNAELLIQYITPIPVIGISMSI